MAGTSARDTHAACVTAPAALCAKTVHPCADGSSLYRSDIAHPSEKQIGIEARLCLRETKAAAQAVDTHFGHCAPSALPSADADGGKRRAARSVPSLRL